MDEVDTRFPMVQSAFENDYVWEKPMPPPPITKSRTVISPVRKMAQEHMCRHYRLAKKKLHHYISITKYLANVDLANTILPTMDRNGQVSKSLPIRS
ncbi:uncharacterized protein [Haliotis cracherodii]|uniref:uncharacterized protein isoform X2 n=1 Tax=Haliotis cracherodii TaxID=6455 RepID=UPI0039E93D9E